MILCLVWFDNCLNCIAVCLQVRSDVSVFEMNIRFTGGFLSAYALSGDNVSFPLHKYMMYDYICMYCVRLPLVSMRMLG